MSEFSPKAYGYSRGCMATAIAVLLEQRLTFCLTLEGGLDNDEGHWVWQSARELCEWLQSFHGIVTSEDTVGRALEAIVRTGRWVRAQLGKQLRRAYYYRPACAESIPHECENHPAMEREQAETTPVPTATDPAEPVAALVSEPVEQPKPKRSRPAPKGFGGSQKPRKAPRAADDGMFSSPASTVTAKDLYERPGLPTGLHDAGGWLSVC